MKKTAVIMSAIIAGAMVLPTAANAQNEYPTFPTRPKDIEFTDLPEEEQKAYLEGVEAYRTALCTAYQNGEYDWDFDLDGDIDVFDAYYPMLRWSELSMSEERDSFALKIWSEENKTYLRTALPFTHDMREKVDENGDITGDGHIDAKDSSYMLFAIFSDKEKGDVNTDGKIDARDASKMLSFYADNSVNIESDYVTEKNMEYLGDLNGDGKVDSSDASFALAEYSKLATE